MSRNIWIQCGSKHRYKNEHDVNLYRKKCEKERGKKLDYYWCQHCKGFHLTSQTTVKIQYDFIGEYEELLSVVS